MARIGFILIGLGLIALLIGIGTFKSKQELFSVGGFRATTTSNRSIPEAQYAGIGLLVLGGIIVVAGWRKRGGQ